MNDVTVTEILDDYAKHGTSRGKDGKDFDWSMSRVGLSNRESAFIFNPVNIGDVVEMKETERNGTVYKNWVKKRVSLEDRLNALEARVAALEADVVPGTASAIKPADEAPKSLKERYHEAKAARQDTVVEDINEDDPIDLSSIPF